MAVKERPLLTDVFERASDFQPRPASAFVYGTSPEERSESGHAWLGSGLDVTVGRVVGQDQTTLTIDVAGTTKILPLRSQSQLSEFLRGLGRGSIYLDITGLAHHIWAPLLRAAFAVGLSVKAVYVEPAEYKFSATPTEGEIFDLSERIGGISPIPGFASLAEGREGDVCFIALLGFEGPRFAYMIEQVQPPGRNIVPVIGVPGFQLQFPFHTYHGNRFPLMQTQSWRNIRYAIANCPFSLFYVLGDIAETYPNHSLKIAPIGTKPHGLGAILYALVSPRPVEIVYDHPVRKAGRTSGASRLLLYHLSSFAFPTASSR
jgi:hypothetical protein